MDRNLFQRIGFGALNAAVKIIIVNCKIKAAHHKYLWMKEAGITIRHTGIK